MQQRRSGGARRSWYWLLVVPYVVMLWAPSYNSMEPSIAGVPFFYWYQFVWIAATALIIWAVYILAHDAERE